MSPTLFFIIPHKTCPQLYYCLTIFILIATGNPLPARAFDCSLAKTSTEKAICASPDLIAYDQKLNAAYKAALSDKSSEQKEHLEQQQRAWIKENDAACHGDDKCLGRRYEERIIALGQPIPASYTATPIISGTITYTMVNVKKKSPYKIDLSYPRFAGTPADSVAKLNKWVKRQIEDCGASTAKMSEVAEKFSVITLNNDIAVIHITEALYCGGPHPIGTSYDYFVDIQSGKGADLWQLLTEQGRKSILKRIVAAGRNIPANDECRDDFSSDMLESTGVSFGYKDRKSLVVEPDFPYVSLACDDSAPVEIAIADLKKLYPPHSPALAILRALQE